MSNILIRHSERSVFRKVTCDCKQPNDCDNELCSMHSAAYLIGKMPPNYPVPAICYEVETIGQGNEPVAVALWYISNPDYGPVCLEYWY